MGLGGKHKRSHHEPDFSKKTVILLVILGTIEIEAKWIAGWRPRTIAVFLQIFGVGPVVPGDMRFRQSHKERA